MKREYWFRRSSDAELSSQVVILNDGETYTDIEGCRVLLLPDHVADEDMDEYVKDNYASAVPLVTSEEPPSRGDPRL